MKLDKEKIKKLHAVAAQNGLIRGGDRNDLIALVMDQTGKEHVSDLTDKEYTLVYARILTMGKGQVPGMMRPAQVKKAWALMYQLMDADPREGVSARERMAGAIRKAIKVDVHPYGDMFRWITEKQGRLLIEELKRYIASAERRQERKSG